MGLAKKFLCTWWEEGKHLRTIRFNKLKLLQFKLMKIRCNENHHVYLHLGTIPNDATKDEIELFLYDIQYTLKEKYGLKGEDIEID